MKIKVTDTIKDYEGKDTLFGAKLLTWRFVIYVALNSMQQSVDNRPLPTNETVEDKERMYVLTKKVYAKDIVSLSVTERALILDKIKEVWNPLIWGRAQAFFGDKKE